MFEIFDDTEWEHGLAKSALMYAKFGWPVLPLAPRSKVPVSTNGVKDATTDLDTVRNWWRRNPNYNIGVATGVKFDVIDIDGEDGADWWKPIGENYLNTLRVKTPRGQHWYFKLFATAKDSKKPHPQVDLKSAGGYIVVPPSINDQGIKYEWINPPLPGARLLVLSDPLPLRSNVIQFPVKAARKGTLPEGDLFTARFMNDYAQAIIDVAEAKEGERNKTLYMTAVYLYEWWWRGHVSEYAIQEGMTSAATKTGLLEADIERTLASAKKRAVDNMRGKAVKRG